MNAVGQVLSASEYGRYYYTNDELTVVIENSALLNQFSSLQSTVMAKGDFLSAALPAWRQLGSMMAVVCIVAGLWLIHYPNHWKKLPLRFHFTGD